MTVLARAASEREPPMTLGHWQDFVGRYFALAVALRRAIRVFEYKQDQRLRMQGGKSLIPELTPEQKMCTKYLDPAMKPYLRSIAWVVTGGQWKIAVSSALREHE